MRQHGPRANAVGRPAEHDGARARSRTSSAADRPKAICCDWWISSSMTAPGTAGSRSARTGTRTACPGSACACRCSSSASTYWRSGNVSARRVRRRSRGSRTPNDRHAEAQHQHDRDQHVDPQRHARRRRRREEDHQQEHHRADQLDTGARPDSQPRCSSGAMSASSAVYGSTATLKKIENRKITTASADQAVDEGAGHEERRRQRNADQDERRGGAQSASRCGRTTRRPSAG